MSVYYPKDSRDKENNWGPTTEPCGTPQDSGEISDTKSPIETLKLLSVRYNENQSKAMPDVPTQSRNLSIRM